MQENVYLASGGKVADLPESLDLDPMPSFTLAEVEQIESAYFNQLSPHDAHRRNILDPNHTHVGIGLARSIGGAARTLGNAQEFLARHVEIAAIPRSAEVGSGIVVSGRSLGSSTFHSIEIGRDSLPRTMTRQELETAGGYRTPASFATYRPDSLDPGRRVKLTKDGLFSTSVVL